MQTAAYELGVDPADFRLTELHQAGAVPVHVRDRASSTTPATTREALQLALEQARLRRPPARAGGGAQGGAPGRDRRRLASPRSSAPGRASTTTSPACACSTRRSCASTRPARPMLKLGVKSQGQGHETTFAQIVAEELGIPPEDIDVQEGDTDNTPVRARHLREPLDADRRRGDRGDLAQAARQGAARSRRTCSRRPRTTSSGSGGRFFVKGAPDRSKTIQDVAFAAYTNLPDGIEAGLEGVHYYDPPNMTYPFGTYAVVVEVDRGTGAVEGAARRRGRRLRRPDQPDDRRGPDHGRARPRASASPRCS